MDWRVKGIAQRTLSATPGGMFIHDLLERLHADGGALAKQIGFEVRVHWDAHMVRLRQLDFDLHGKQMLEIGSGRLPVMPLCFALAGVERCITMDLRRRMGSPAVMRTLRRLEPHLADIARMSGQDIAQVRGRWREWMDLRDGQAVLDAAHIVYMAPKDATATGLPDGSVDLVLSNSVLEHVPQAELHRLMAETRRILSPDGLAVHNVNCGDHYAYFDHHITQIHYLLYSEEDWRKWNTTLQYQNRLRASDFLAAARQAGLDIVLDSHKPRPALLELIPGMEIAEEFKHYPVEELCCTSIDFVARKGRGLASVGLAA